MYRALLLSGWRAWVVLIGLAGSILTAVPQDAFAQKPAAADAAAKAKPKAEDVVVVEAEGEGLNKEQAVRAALRAALEKGGKQEIFSDTKVRNFQLMHDTIISRAQGIIKDYEIIKGPTKVIRGGTIKVWIKAKVSKKVLAESWGEVQNLLNQIGRPKIMVYIKERIDGKEEEQSILETRIEEKLLKSGFDLVERSAIQAAREKEKADATAEDNVAKLQAIAKSFKAHIFITGTANANQAGLEDNPYAGKLAIYNCDAQIKVYYTDTAKLLASKGLPVTRGAARGKKEFSPQAGKQALAFAGTNIVQEIYAQVMERWVTAISAGGELILEVEGLKLPAVLRLKKGLTGIKKVEHVNMDFSKGIATYRINAKLSAEDLAMALSEGEFAKMVELVDLKSNRIQAKAVKQTPRGAAGGTEK